MLELAGEVQETLGRAYGLPDDVDEDDLEAGECSLNFHHPPTSQSLSFFLPDRVSELDALGDDFLADSEDTSYLDAVSAPDPPTGVPQETGKTKTQGGVKLDEFGLPELPN